jgi:3-dehydroquinate synthase
MTLPIFNTDLRLFDFESFLQYSSVLVLCDQNTQIHCYPLLAKHLPAHSLVVMEAGEQHKTLASCERVWRQMQTLDRKSLLLNLGGGVVSDLGGFCAATFKRGIAFANLPTSLLAMVDAAFGGKYGVDFDGLKNQIGLFAEPEFVWVYPPFLQTLPKQELVSGFAEVIKYGLLAGGDFWQKVSGLQDLSFCEDFIAYSLALKAHIVGQDPKEKGLRKVLNLGHTFAHALEAQYLMDGQSVLHGQAVAAGLIVEGYISQKRCGLPREELSQIVQVVSTHFHRLSWEKGLFELAKNDKKNSKGSLRMALLERIGKPVFDVEVNRALFEEALDFYSAL